VAFAAVPATAAPVSHHATSMHHSNRLVLKGLVAGHHHRSMTIFAKTAKVGAVTEHNQRVTVTFARSAHGRVKVPTGDRIKLVATGAVSGHHVTITRASDETVTSAPATLFFGTVTAISGNLLTVSQDNRDNGDHGDGGDHHGPGDGNDNDSARMSPADHGPGGPGGGNDGPGHQITIDDSAAAITVDGAAGTLAVGNTVAVLGEQTTDTIVAASVFGFTQAPTFARGEISNIAGDNVTFGDDNHGHGGDDIAGNHGGDNDDSMTVSLTGVPLALNGDEGATPSQLVVGDKLIVIGSTNATTSQFTPELAFAFNGDDHNPCGDNDGGDDHGGDGGSDG
jgi:hypothetical protein